MLDRFMATNDTNDEGFPSGGTVDGVGLRIQWQRGPLGRGADRKPPNGAFVETVIAAAKQRLEFYQEAADGRFACIENSEAIKHLDMALLLLAHRTRDREAREVEGTHAK